MTDDVKQEVEAAVAAAESEGATAVATEKSRVLAAIAGLEAHLQTLELDVLAFTTHEKSAVEQYLLSLKTRVHSLLLRLI
jgi:hypothetical protein